MMLIARDGEASKKRRVVDTGVFSGTRAGRVRSCKRMCRDRMSTRNMQIQLTTVIKGIVRTSSARPCTLYDVQTTRTNETSSHLVFLATRSVLLSTLLFRQHQNKIVRIIICVCAGVWVNLSRPCITQCVEVWWFAMICYD